MMEDIQSCGCSHCDAKVMEPMIKEDSDSRAWKIKASRMGIALVLLLIAALAPLAEMISLSLYIIAYVLSGYEVVYHAAKGLWEREWLDENFLMLIASIAAFVIGEYPEGVAVIIFYGVGGLFEDMAIHRSRRSIKALMAIKPDVARKKIDDEWVLVDPNDIIIGDLIMVKPGERLPLDGRVIEGSSSLDTSAITGESVYREVDLGSDVFAGTVNVEGVITIEVTKIFKDSTVSRILELVEQASEQKANTEKFITKFARYYTPSVVGAAVLLAVIPPLMGLGAFSTWFYRAAIFLVVSCPCGLVISVPLGYFGGIGGASRQGILIKGGNFLEVLRDVDTVVMDKTGTLTKGNFEVIHIEQFETLDVLAIAAQLEQFSQHPIGRSIVSAYQGDLKTQAYSEVREIKGKGLSGIYQEVEDVQHHLVLAGNRSFLEEQGILVSTKAQVGTSVYVAYDGRLIGVIHLADVIKPEAKESLAALKSLGVSRLIMLTGDFEGTASAVASEVGITEYHAQLLPEDKVKHLESFIRSATKKVMFIGDGINDAPVLARADVGVAMGGVGSDAAIEAADVVIMSDNLLALPKAIRLARFTHQVVWQNIIFSFAVKGLILLLAVFGLANMWLAVFADVGVAFIAILNAVRVLQKKDLIKLD